MGRDLRRCADPLKVHRKKITTHTSKVSKRVAATPLGREKGLTTKSYLCKNCLRDYFPKPSEAQNVQEVMDTDEAESDPELPPDDQEVELMVQEEQSDEPTDESSEPKSADEHDRVQQNHDILHRCRV